MKGSSAQHETEEITEGLLDVAVVEICPEWTFKFNPMPIWREVKNVMKRMKSMGLVGLVAMLSFTIQVSFGVETSGQALYDNA